MPRNRVDQPTKLFLILGGHLYYLTRIQTDREVAQTAWRLMKEDGECYDVAMTEFGIECSCPDAHWRKRAEKGELCKHAASLVAVSLLPPLPRRMETPHAPAR